MYSTRFCFSVSYALCIEKTKNLKRNPTYFTYSNFFEHVTPNTHIVLFDLTLNSVSSTYSCNNLHTHNLYLSLTLSKLFYCLILHTENDVTKLRLFEQEPRVGWGMGIEIKNHRSDFSF